jgi:sporulation protein YlmC with PRC-barrel domain
MSRKLHFATATTVASLISFGAASQQAQQAGEPVGQPAQHQQSQCLEDLQALSAQMQQDGFWLGGYPQIGIAGEMAPGAGMAAPQDPAVTGQPAMGDPATGDPAMVEQQAAGQPVGQAASPWGATGWQHQPQTEMRILHQAAHVLARQGNEQACASVTQAMADRYGEQVAQLQELGVDPMQVSAWRQAQIADAQPVGDALTQVRVDNLLGRNVWSPEDENYGDIRDVVLDPQTGRVQYVTISRGGFLGFGQEEIVVPWDMLYVTSDLATFVLPVDQATLEAAPQVQGGGLLDGTQTGSINREQVDAYWAQHAQQPQQ